MARIIQVFEFEKLTLHEDSRGRYLQQRELEKLYEFNEKKTIITLRVSEMVLDLKIM